GQRTVECLFVARNGQRARHATDWDFGAIAHGLQVDQMNAMAGHGGHEEMVVASRVVAVVGRLDGQSLHDGALLHVHDVYAVSVPDRDANESAVRRSRALVGKPAQLDRLDDLVGCGVDDQKRVDAFYRGEEPSSVTGYCRAVRASAGQDSAADLEG